MTDPVRSGRIDWLKLLGEAGLLVGLVGVWLYVAGWRFAERYFLNFGVNLSMLELPREYLITYGFWVFRDRLAIMALIVGALGAGMWAWRRFCPPPPDAAIIALVLCALIPIYGGASYFGRAVAEDRFAAMAQEDYPGYRNLRVAMTKAWDGDERLKSQLNDANACYRLIFADQKSVFVFRPSNDPSVGQAETVQLPRDKITTLRIRQISRSCAE